MLTRVVLIFRLYLFFILNLVEFEPFLVFSTHNNKGALRWQKVIPSRNPS
jgi:hypothetical protein